MIRWLVASLHLIALPIGFAAVVVRGASLRGQLDKASLDRAFRADSLWGLAAVLWISTGVARAFFGLEKGTAYYLTSHAFWTKMALLFAILVLEIRPMSTLIQWRRKHQPGESFDAGRAKTLSRVSFIQAVLVVIMVFAATAMARGLFYSLQEFAYVSERQGARVVRHGVSKFTRGQPPGDVRKPLHRSAGGLSGDRVASRPTCARTP